MAGLSSLSFNLFTVSVGASGALFGLYGYMIVHALSEKTADRFRILRNFLILMVVYALIGGQFNFDNAGHFGGVIAGMILRFADLKSNFRFTPLIMVLLLIGTYWLIPRHQVQYFHAFQGFVEADRRIISAFNAQGDDSVYYQRIEELTRIPDSTIALFRAVDFYTHDLAEDTITIIGYLQARKKQVNYYLTQIRNESYIYIDSLNFENDKISKLPPINYNLNYNVNPDDTTTAQVTSEEAFESVYQRYDENWLETEAEDFAYYRMGKKDSLGDWHGRVLDYYSDGAIQMKGVYDRGLKHGVFIYYDSDSTYSSAGRYREDYHVGKWEIFYQNGRKASEIRYTDGPLRLENSWDTLGNARVINGQGEQRHYYHDGQLEMEAFYKDGLKEGFEKGYDEDGNLVYQEYYEGGELLKGIAFYDNIRHEYDESVWWVYPEGGYAAFNAYLETENYLKSDTLGGKVRLRFDVSAKGEITEVRYLERLDRIRDAYAKELLLNGPKWNPGRLHGHEPFSGTAEISVWF